MDLEENWSQIRDARIKHEMLDYVYHKQIYEDKYSNMRYDIHLQGNDPNIMDDIKPKTKEMQGNHSHISPHGTRERNSGITNQLKWNISNMVARKVSRLRIKMWNAS